MFPLWSNGSFSCKLRRKGKAKSRGVRWERRCRGCGKETIPGNVWDFFFKVLSKILCPDCLWFSNVSFQNFASSIWCISVPQHLDSAGLSGIWFENSQSSLCDWFGAYCRWLHIYVLLRWQWFSTTYAHTWDSRGLFSMRIGLCICYDWCPNLRFARCIFNENWFMSLLWLAFSPNWTSLLVLY